MADVPLATWAPGPPQSLPARCAMRLLVVCLVGFLFTSTASDQQKTYAPETKRTSTSQTHNTSSWKPQTSKYRRPYIQRVWLSSDKNTSTKFRSNHSENIKSFAYAINDTNRFIRYLKEEESKLNLEKVKTYDKYLNSSFQYSSAADVDDSDDETLETSDGYDASFEDSRPMEDVSTKAPTTMASTTTEALTINRRRYRPTTPKPFSKIIEPSNNTQTTRAPNPFTSSPYLVSNRKRYRTTTDLSTHAAALLNHTTTPYTITPITSTSEPNITDSYSGQKNLYRFSPVRQNSTNSSALNDKQRKTTLPYQVVYVNSYSKEPKRYNTITYSNQDETKKDSLPKIEQSPIPTTGSIYIQYPAEYVNLGDPRRYQTITETTNKILPSSSDTQQSTIRNPVQSQNRQLELYSTFPKRYSAFTVTSRELNRFLPSSTHSDRFEMASTSEPYPVPYSNDYRSIVASTEEIYDKLYHSDDTQTFKTSKLQSESYISNQNSYRNHEITDNSTQQFQMSPSFYDPYSVYPRYKPTSSPRREHSVKVLPSSINTQHFSRDSVLSYIEEPYDKQYRRPSSTSRGTSGNISPILNDTKPLSSTALPYPIPYIEAPYHLRKSNHRASTRRRSKSSNRRHRKHRRRGHRKFWPSSSYNAVIAPSINLLPPLLPTFDDVYSFGNNRLQQQQRLSVVEGRRHREHHVSDSPRREEYRQHSKKRGAKATASPFDVKVPSRRFLPPEPGRMDTSGSSYGELRLSPVETTYYKRRQVSMRQFLMGDMEEHQGSIPGVAGRDYPTYNQPPATNFSCLSLRGQHGYFADPSTRCQVFYICPGDGRGEPMLCPNGTMFNQLVSVCDWWFNVDCGAA